MGRPKMLLPWGDSSVLGHLIARWRALGARQIAVLCAQDDFAIGDELERLGFPAKQRIMNPAPERGMFSSIQCAARWHGWFGSISHWAIALGDQPQVRVETFVALLRLAATHPQKLCQLTRNGRPRHPVLLPAAAFQSLRVSSHENLKQFLASLPLERALEESGDPGLDLDLDRPPDYESAVRTFLHAETAA